MLIINVRGEYSVLYMALIVIGAVLLALSAYFLVGALSMISYMAYYHCMGMMCGMMMYYPLVLPITILAIGIALIIVPVMLMRKPGTQVGDGSMGSGGVTSSVVGSDVLKLLPKAEREVMEYIMKSGGEVYQYQIMKDLGLSKVRAWRIVRRLEEKGLVDVIKVKGRNLVKLKSKGDLNKAQ